MKKIILLLTTASIVGCTVKGQEAANDFIAERVARTASFVVNENIEVLFPLFGAFEERKWETNWDPILIYPDKEIIEEGTTFKTKAHGHGSESEYLWIVSKYEPENYLVQYMVSTSNRYWTITVKCNDLQESKTKTTVTYSFLGLNSKGHELNKKALERMYQHDLQDWKEALNSYLAKR